MIIVGNDIIDLGESLPSNKSQDPRFLRRVFTPNEQQLILVSSNPELQLWFFWAAKETAYKIISKIKTPPIFSHKLFQVTIKSNVNLSESKQRLDIIYDNYIIQAIGIWDKNKLHVAGYLNTKYSQSQTHETHGHGIDLALLEQQTKTQLYCLTENDITYWSEQNNLDLHFSKTEQESINHTASATAKYKLKQDLAQKLGWDIKKLEVIRPSLNKKMHPPFLLYHGKKTNIDISLSHHGEWVGWTYTCPKTYIL